MPGLTGLQLADPGALTPLAPTLAEPGRTWGCRACPSPIRSPPVAGCPAGRPDVTAAVPLHGGFGPPLRRRTRGRRSRSGRGRVPPPGGEQLPPLQGLAAPLPSAGVPGVPASDQVVAGGRAARRSTRRDPAAAGLTGADSAPLPPGLAAAPDPPAAPGVPTPLRRCRPLPDRRPCPGPRCRGLDREPGGTRRCHAGRGPADPDLPRCRRCPPTPRARSPVPRKAFRRRRSPPVPGRRRPCRRLGTASAAPFDAAPVRRCRSRRCRWWRPNRRRRCRPRRRRTTSWPSRALPRRLAGDQGWTGWSRPR